jgi:hypothetical protein
MFHLNRNPSTHEHLHAQNDETNGNIEFLKPYPVVAADALLQIGTAVISAVLSLDEHLSQANNNIEMDGNCSMHEGDEICIQNFYRET